MNSIRAFFAVMLPREIQGVLSHAIAQIKESPNKIIQGGKGEENVGENVRWIRQESWHITLQFIAKFRRDDLKDLIAAIRLEASNIAPFALELGSLEWFPSAQHPKILALSLKSQEELMHLSQALGQRLAALGYPVESRPYRAHLSLARVIHVHLNPTEPIVADVQLQIPSFHVDAYYLLESRPDKGQHHYCPLAKFDL